MQLQESETYADLDLSEGELLGATGVSMEHCRLRGVSLAGTVFERGQFRDVRFDSCDLSGCRLAGCRLERVVLQGCRLTGLQIAECRLLGFECSDSSGSYLSFDRTRAGGALFERCVLSEATFIDCDFDLVEFRESDLRASVIEAGSWQGADLRGTRIDGIRVELANLKGALVDAGQAVQLLEGFGLRVG